jgi:hypothetical protein
MSGLTSPGSSPAKFGGRVAAYWHNKRADRL